LLLTSNAVISLCNPQPAQRGLLLTEASHFNYQAPVMWVSQSSVCVACFIGPCERPRRRGLQLKRHRFLEYGPDIGLLAASIRALT